MQFIIALTAAVVGTMMAKEKRDYLSLDPDMPFWL